MFIRKKILKLVAFLLVTAMVGSILLACAPKQTPTTPTLPTTPGAPTSEAPVSKIIWRANSITPKDRVVHRNFLYGDSLYGYDEMVRQIAEATGGRFEIQTHYSNELGFGARDWPKLLKEGLIEISDLPMLMGSMYIPGLAYEAIPLHLGAPPPVEKIRKVHEARRLIYDELLPLWNGKRLGTWYNVPNVSAPSEMTSAVRIDSLQDFKGVTIRQSGPEPATFWANFGAKSVIISLPEIYMAFKTGLIEASNRDRGDYIAFKLHEVAKYLIVYYPGRASLTSYGWAASTLHWPKLPPDIQTIVADSYRALEEHIDMASSDPNWKTLDTVEVEKIIKDFGITVITLPEADLAQIQELADRQTAEWLAKADDLGKRLYKSDMEALGRPERYEQLLAKGKELIGE